MRKVLFTAEHLSLSIGEQVIFNDLALSCAEGERIAVIGRNGSGKSTLLRAIAGTEQVSAGSIARARDLRMEVMPQDFALDLTRSAKDNVRDGLRWIEELRRRYEDPEIPASELPVLEKKLQACDGWNPEHKLDELLDALHIAHPERPAGQLSGGEKRRITLARAVIGEPDLLLLDEPTNHLDVTTVEWIEEFLSKRHGSCIFVTHDRYFLDRLATRIVELDHGSLYSYEGSYADYLAGREARIAEADVVEAKRRKFLRDEIEWVRRSPKARLRRNVGRVKHFEAVAAEEAPQHDRDMDLVIPRAPHLGNQTVMFQDVSFSYPGQKILEHFDFEFAPGTRLGIVGPNGAGKTTFLQLLTGRLAPDSGTVKIAPAVQFNYIDQSRMVLDESKTVEEEIGGGFKTVSLGTETISIWGYLKRFLFEDQRIHTRIDRLSGGEKARLALAKVLKQGGNFLILDEPTNDLDLASLRLLEEALLDFDGCAALVSHDRYFLNRVATHILGFDESGRVFFTPGDYDYYLAKRPVVPVPAAPAAVRPVPVAPQSVARPKPVKLSYREAQELEHMEEKILEAEARVAEIEGIFSRPDFFSAYGNRSAELQQDLAAAKEQVRTLYDRWEELEKKR